MNVYSYAKQVRAVIVIEVTILAIAFGVAFYFWRHLCDDTLESCLAAGPVAKLGTFFVLSAIRPFVFTPLLFVGIIAGKAFGPISGALLTALGSVLSCAAVFGITKLVGKRMAKPWLRANLPATFKFIRSQDYKLVFAGRLIPFVPFDVLSFLFGALDFRFTSVLIGTFLGTLPEAYIYTKLVDPNDTMMSSAMTTLVVISLCVIAPLVIFEFLGRKQGTGMWQLLRAMWREIHYEVKVNNEIVKRQIFDKERTPVLLLYGFFSSRRAVTVLERMLTARGHQVLSFNLGGLLGTFFTRDILETANFIDYKIKRQIERHGFKKIHIVAHSKGGMVALWWVLKLGGAKYCDKVITMGTPFSGSRLTYFALVTPLGFLWRDVFQMRPGSMFLRSLQDVEVPPDVEIFCLHSIRDRVARGANGIYKPRIPTDRIKGIAMNHISHFEFLYRRDVGDVISKLLKGSEATITPVEKVATQSLLPASSAPVSLAPTSGVKQA